MLNDPERISFAEWLVELNIYAVRTGLIGQLLILVTGQLCWYPFYAEGFCPQAALEMAENDATKFGADYWFEDH